MKLFVTALFLPLVMSSTVPAGSGFVQSTFGTPCTPKDAALTAPQRALSAIPTPPLVCPFLNCFSAYLTLARAGDIGKLLGAKWRELDEEKRQPYVEQAAKDKMRAEEEKRVYELSQKSGSVCGDE
ncbi:hypothetical protein B0H14DRAFT_3859529 [Mycena olivaceomarginata]|nr:hypothetical protein B0H14DRAFT_3859529 [Mycena olivaceomarginata]